MTDAGDGFSLLRRGGRQERTGATEQEPVELALAELIQKISAQDDGAAPTAGPSGVDVLSLQIEDQHAAVGVPVLQVDSNLVELVQEDLLAHLAQVPGDNQVKILRRSSQIVKVGADGLKGAGSHGGSHVVGIGDTQIHNGPHRGGLYKGSVSFAANQRRTGTGYGPLSSGTPLTTIAQGIAVLPL